MGCFLHVVTYVIWDHYLWNPSKTHPSSFSFGKDTWTLFELRAANSVIFKTLLHKMDGWWWIIYQYFSTLVSPNTHFDETDWRKQTQAQTINMPPDKIMNFTRMLIYKTKCISNALLWLCFREQENKLSKKLKLWYNFCLWIQAISHFWLPP